MGLGLRGRVKGWPNIYKFSVSKVVFPIYSRKLGRHRRVVLVILLLRTIVK